MKKNLNNNNNYWWLQNAYYEVKSTVFVKLKNNNNKSCIQNKTFIPAVLICKNKIYFELFYKNNQYVLKN